MYRPTVRYDDVFKGYVENIYNATTLDRNQIIRAALFIAGHTEQFSKIIEPHLKRGMSLPKPIWDEDQHDLWINQKADVQVEEVKKEKPIVSSTTKYEQKRVDPPLKASPKPKVFTGGIKHVVK